MVYDYVQTDLVGTLILAGDEKGLRYLNFIKGKHPLAIRDGWHRDKAYFITVKNQLAAYFAGEHKTFDVDLYPEGTSFQLKVWSALLKIPYGKVVSYQWIARRIGKPDAARAVGAANGRNPISIIIPCHRVIGKDGTLTGYGGGIDVKQRLIRLENRVATLPNPIKRAFSGR
jgi:methylated-DNA-[protein]-cysteine S-methyltransferase